MLVSPNAGTRLRAGRMTLFLSVHTVYMHVSWWGGTERDPNQGVVLGALCNQNQSSEVGVRVGQPIPAPLCISTWHREWIGRPSLHAAVGKVLQGGAVVRSMPGLEAAATVKDLRGVSR